MSSLDLPDWIRDVGGGDRTKCDEKPWRPEAAQIVRNKIESWRYLCLLGTMIG